MSEPHNREWPPAPGLASDATTNTPHERPYVPFANAHNDEPAVRIEDDSTNAQWWIALSPLWISSLTPRSRFSVLQAI